MTSRIDSEVQNSSPLTSKSTSLNPQAHQCRRHPFHSHKEPDMFAYSKPSSNVVYPISDFVSYHRLFKAHLGFALQWFSMSISSHIQEALENPKWKSTIRCKWVFLVKYTSYGTIDRYKARLVAKGYAQTYGIDYQETFTTVAMMNTIRVILSPTINLDWSLKQFDIKDVFLHGDLLEEVYMDPPPGFTPKEGKVCRLKKAIYGLKQSPRAWFGRLSYAMMGFGYKQCNDGFWL